MILLQGGCPYLFSYLNSIKDAPKKIRCIFIHNPTLSTNDQIVHRFKKGPLKYLPYAHYIIPLVYELVSEIKGESYDPFKQDLVTQAHTITTNNNFARTPIVISYDNEHKNDAISLYQIMIKNNVLPTTNQVLLLEAAREDFNILINNIISTYFEETLFEKLINEKNSSLARTECSRKTDKMIRNSVWFASKTPLKKFIIRRARDAFLLIVTLFFYKAIKYMIFGIWHRS